MISIIYYPDSTTHCALALTGLGKNKNFYLSFMPNDLGGGFRLHKMDDDFKHRATRIVNVQSEESCGYGLSERAILNWYKQTFKNNSGFSLLTNNCATVVYEALREGQLHSKTLGNRLVEEKNWFLDLPYSLLKYGERLSQVIQKMHRESLEKQNDWIINKILEMENLYNASDKLSKNDFLYSFFIKAINIKTNDTDLPNRNKERFVNNFIKKFIKTLQQSNYPTDLIDEIQTAFECKNQALLLSLSTHVYQFKFNKPFSITNNVLSFFNVNKSVKLTNYTKTLKSLIDDNKNLYKDYFAQKHRSSLVMRAHYRGR